MITKISQNVFKIDGLKSSHPISIPVKHPDEISEIFDKISYSKGASIIRMMDNFLTTDTFRKVKLQQARIVLKDFLQGLTNYLNNLKFEAAEQDDLWRYLTEQAHKDGTLSKSMSVKTVMDTWTLQMGFPVVTINRNYNDNTATVTQKRFLIGEADKNDKAEYSWWIPLTFASPGGRWNDTYSNLWLEKGQQSKEVPGMPAANQAVVFNVQQTGYYRWLKNKIIITFTYLSLFQSQL